MGALYACCGRPQCDRGDCLDGSAGACRLHHRNTNGIADRRRRRHHRFRIDRRAAAAGVRAAGAHSVSGSGGASAGGGTRGGQALYHIRGYLAAHTEGGTTSLAWAFDVYDAERKRAFRLRGEERAPGSGAGAGSWAAVNDAILQRIASTSITQLMTFIASDRTTAGATAALPQPPGPGPEPSPALLAYSAGTE